MQRLVTLLLATLLSGCAASTGPSDEAILNYTRDLHECANRYVALGLSPAAAVYGPCAAEVPTP